jgi:hypothetical protein
VNARGALLILLAACGDPAAHVRLAPVPLPGGCGLTSSKTALRVIAFTPGGQVRRTVPPTDIDAFPADTEQLGVEVIGGASGGFLAIGKTAPLDYGALAEGTEIPIVMVPPSGFCPTAPMSEPRVAPVVARAGDGVLVVGGLGSSGQQLLTADYYDASTAAFSPVDLPASLLDADNGLAGAVLTELSDGRVVLSGTASHALAIFDPATRTFSTPALFDHRAYHAAIAPASDQLFILGGCADIVGGACSGPSLRSSFTYDLTDLAQRTRGPTLPDMAARYGAHIHDLGEQRDGVHRYLLAGGFGDPGVADRFGLTEDSVTTITGLHAQDALLDGGALLTAFEPDGSPQTGATAILAPDGTAAVPQSFAPPVDGARLVTLEDGSVLAIGGDPSGRVARYLPTTDAWSFSTAAGQGPGPLDAPRLIRLADGSVLVLGGRGATADAWIYRPSLVGATSGSVVALSDGSTEGVLTATDPSSLSRASGFVLSSTEDDLRARVLVGGPRTVNGSITASLTVMAGGVALIARQTGPGHAMVGRLVPGEPARIQNLAGGQLTNLCSGTTVTAEHLAAQVTLAIHGATATISTPTVSLVSCEVPAGERGAWGVAAAGSSAQIDVHAVTVERAR